MYSFLFLTKCHPRIYTVSFPQKSLEHLGIENKSPCFKILKKEFTGVLLWQSRLWIQHGHRSGLGCCCGVGAILAWHLLRIAGAAKKKKKRNRIHNFQILQ